MLRLNTLAVLAIVAALGTTSSAAILDFQVAADADGAITCVSCWDSPTMKIDGVQKVFGPSHVLSDPDHFTTDTALDPTINMNNVMLNDTGVAWTSYLMTVAIRAKNASTALSGLSLSAGVNSPGGWTANVTGPLTLTSTYTDSDGRTLSNYYIGTIEYSGPTLANGGTLDTTYTLSFQGATSYLSYQEMTPVPEPVTIGLLIAGALPLLRRRNPHCGATARTAA